MSFLESAKFEVRIFSMVYCRDTQDAKHLCRLLVPQEPHARLCISHRRKAAKDKHHSNIEEKRSFSTSILHSPLSILNFKATLGAFQPQFSILHSQFSILEKLRFSTSSLHFSLFFLLFSLKLSLTVRF